MPRTRIGSQPTPRACEGLRSAWRPEALVPVRTQPGCVGGAVPTRSLPALVDPGVSHRGGGGADRASGGLGAPRSRPRAQGLWRSRRTRPAQRRVNKPGRVHAARARRGRAAAHALGARRPPGGGGGNGGRDGPLHGETLGSRRLGKTGGAESHASGAGDAGARTGT